MSARLRRTLAACTALAALAACPIVTGTAAHAAPPATLAPAYGNELPPIGAEIPSSILAVDSKLEYRGKTYTLDFRGGISQRVDVNPNDPINSVRLRTIGFKVSADTEGTSVTFEQNVVVDAPSMLRITQRFPPQYEERDVLSFAAVIDEPGQRRVVLETKEPMVLTASLTQYPSRGDRYTLEKPVDLVSPEHPNTVVARLTEFPSKRGGL